MPESDIMAVETLIYKIRGQHVILDRDIAPLYGVTTGALNQAVKRNIDRFPEDFMFQLSDEEVENWKSQIVITNSVKKGLRHNPYAFSEHGVLMLASVLRSEIAVQASINIARTFSEMRRNIVTATKTTAELAELKARVERIERYSEENMRAVNDLSEDLRQDINNLYNAIGVLSLKVSEQPDEPPRRKIGFKQANKDD